MLLILYNNEEEVYYNWSRMEPKDIYLTGNPQITFLKSFIVDILISLWNVFLKQLMVLQLYRIHMLRLVL